MPVLSSSLILLGHGALAAAASCTPENCARAVIGSQRGASFTSSARSDCSSFLRATVYPATVTSTSTATAQVQATATPATGNALCQNGAFVNGLSAPCGTQPCNSFNFRIEGAIDTIYEGPILTGPQSITTPSGGTHNCDGTNNNANPDPGSTPTDAIASAGGLCGFDFDGTYSNSFSDYFITRISNLAQTSTQFWGILNNFQFTPTGGCQFEMGSGDQSLWAFDAFNKNYFLDVQPRTANVDLGTMVVFTVTGYDGNGGSAVPVSGASFNGLTTNSNGQVVFVATQPGTFRYKATRSDSLRSPVVVITVN